MPNVSGPKIGLHFEMVTIDCESEIWVKAALGEFGNAEYLDFDDPAYDNALVRQYNDGNKFMLVEGEFDLVEVDLPRERTPIFKRNYAELDFLDDVDLAGRRLKAELQEMKQSGIPITYKDEKGRFVRDYGNGRIVLLKLVNNHFIEIQN